LNRLNNDKHKCRSPFRCYYLFVVHSHVTSTTLIDTSPCLLKFIITKQSHEPIISERVSFTNPRSFFLKNPPGMCSCSHSRHYNMCRYFCRGFQNNDQPLKTSNKERQNRLENKKVNVYEEPLKIKNESLQSFNNTLDWITRFWLVKKEWSFHAISVQIWNTRADLKYQCKLQRRYPKLVRRHSWLPMVIQGVAKVVEVHLKPSKDSRR